jgi:Ser/Thr protein kinase RdoA (MazF antagonist)
VFVPVQIDCTPARSSTAMSTPAPAITSATLCTDAELHEAVSHFLPDDPATLKFTRAFGGVNNKCSFLVTPEGKEYLLRIYNNGNNTPRVAYEHAVLKLLSKKQFSFQLPVPLPLLKDASATSVLLQSGASACLFPRIPGGPADASSGTMQAIGKATAELVRGMKDVTVPLPLPNPLYRNMYDGESRNQTM